MKSRHTSFLLLILSMFLISCNDEESDNSNSNDPDIEWEIEFLGEPMGDIALHSITLHPEDDNLWFVGSYVRGLMITRDGGNSWENIPGEGNIPVFEIDPNNPSNMYLGLGENLFYSSDYGENWNLIQSFPRHIISLLISEVNYAIYSGVRWEDSELSNGIYISEDNGDTWNLYSYGVNEDGLIPWDIEEDPVNEILYIATEIYDHPTPYNPPFLRSSDGGKTWDEISGILTWHAIRIQIHPETQDVYVLTEGAGLYRSSDFGDNWEFLSNSFWLEFIIDRNYPQRFWGGNHTANNSSGGVFLSYDEGKTFRKLGMENLIVNSLCFNKNSTHLYATAYQTGLFVIRQKQND